MRVPELADWIIERISRRPPAKMTRIDEVRREITDWNLTPRVYVEEVSDDAKE